MKIRYLILIGLLSILVFSVALFPASLAWKLVGGFAGNLPISVERVGGTIWNGYVVGSVRNAPLPGSVMLGWDLKGLNLLMGDAAIDMTLENEAFFVRGGAHWGLMGFGLKNLNGEAQIDRLQPILNQFNASASGLLKIDNVSAEISGDRVTQAQGMISWAGGDLKVPGRRSRIAFPAVKATVSELEGDLYIAVNEGENGLLAELGFLPTKGLWSYKVMQRALNLVGQGSGEADDKVLIKVQQPLPF